MLRNAPITPYIPVADLERARKFYEEKLGLDPGKEFAEDDLQMWQGHNVLYVQVRGSRHLEG